MKIRRSITKYSFIAIVLLVISLSVFLYKKVSLKNEIDKILTEESYSYLPEKAKNYVKEVYEETGEILLTEKNKKDNEPYLNPLYVEYLEMSLEEQKNEEVIPIATVIDYVNDMKVDGDSASLTKYDLRNVNGTNFVPPNRNQKGLGICWAFSSAGVVETHVLKTANKAYVDSNDEITERQLDYSSAIDGIKDYRSEYVTFINDRVLGDGANFYIATISMASGTSLFKYNDFKEYDDHDLDPMELSEVLSYQKSAYEVDETINMAQMDYRASTSNLTSSQQNIRTNFINEVKENIQNYGSAYVSTYMDSSCYYYDSNLGNTVIDVYNCNKTGGHAMQIIGWNDNLEYKYCNDNNKHTAYTSSCSNPVRGKGVWILKNSWGSSTANPYLAYDSTSSQIHFVKSLTKSENKVWDNSYIYGDGNGYRSNYQDLSDLRINGEEYLKRIKFITNTTGATYTVTVIDSNNKSHSYNKTVTGSGLITIEITDNIKISKNSTISISSAAGYFYNKVEVFTKNASTAKYVDLSTLNNKKISDSTFRVYSETKNISSGSTLLYRVFDSNNNDVTNKVVITNNVVAENNVNALISMDELNRGNYTLKVYQDNKLLSTAEFTFDKMTGLGTEEDPYVITNSTQLKQIENDLGGYYVLGNDIDLTDDTREGGKFYVMNEQYGVGFGWEPIAGFYGTLDGQGHKIIGLYQKTYSNDGITYLSMDNAGGLFTNIRGNVTIKNLTLDKFDITCHEECGALFNRYVFSWGNTNNIQETYTLTLKNIAVVNSVLKASTTYDAGLLGGIVSATPTSTVNVENIYVDSTIYNAHQKGGLFESVSGGNQLNIKNIQIITDLNETNNDGSGTGPLFASSSFANISISNVLSTVQGNKIKGLLADEVSVWSDGVFNVNGINVLNMNGADLFRRNVGATEPNISNVNKYTIGTDSYKLTQASSYSNWEGFDDNWELKTIDGIKRYPVLKFVDFEYTSIPDIHIDLDQNEVVNLYELITPQTAAAKRIKYSVLDESIITIDNDGNITPKKQGNTAIHVESLYDGYIKDVPVTITGDYYNISFKSNGGVGSMNEMMVKRDETTTLTKNTFVREGYKFKGWSSKADGSGSFFKDQAVIINLIGAGNTYNLYAQWEPIKYTIKYDSNGGAGTMGYQVLEYDQEAMLFKSLFSKTNYKFVGWNTRADGSGKSYKDLENVKNLTKVDGSEITLYAQWKSSIEYSLSISTYQVNNNSNTIDLVSVGTDLDTYKKNIKTNYRVEVDMKGNNYISTGSELKLYTNDGKLYKTYINIVRGDINGDAKMSALDYVMVKNHIMGTNNITNDIYKKAADVNNDGKISALDYVSIKNKIMGG